MGKGGLEFGHGQGGVNHGFDFSLAVHLRQLGHHGGVGLGFALGKLAPEHTHDGGAFEQRQVQRQRRNGAGRKAHHQVAPTPANGAEGLLGIVAAHGVVNDFWPFALGQRFDRFAQVFGAVVDGGIGTNGFAQRAFFVSRGCGNDTRPGGFGNLNGRGAHATCSAQHQHGLSSLELGAVYQRVVRGGVNHDEGGRIDKREPLRQGHAQVSGGQRVGGKTAGARQTGHVLAYLQVAHAFAHGLHNASVFRAGHKGQGGLHLVFVLHYQQVRKIQARRLDFKQHLALAGLGGGQFFPSQGVNAHGVFTKPGMHESSPKIFEMISQGVQKKLPSVSRATGALGWPVRPTIQPNSVCI